MLRHYNSELIRALQQRGFAVYGTQLLLISELGEKVRINAPSRRKKPVLVHAGIARSVPSRSPSVPLRVLSHDHNEEREIVAQMMPYGSSWEEELNLLFAALPPRIASAAQRLSQGRGDLLEIVLDLGREPEARFTDGEAILDSANVGNAEIDYVTEHVGLFGDDNRAGIERTLHRISAIRNRKGTIVGLTCRVGRAVTGTIDIIKDMVISGQSILLLGPPGIGKTTMLRECARVLSDECGKRVVIVDTSNEIAGDGDIPHPGIGRSRRMQVRTPALQHAVMIEAVENHMPQCIVIDEIGTELEAVAARTIAERGVQLVGTAHGSNIDSLLVNPTLNDLLGGIQTVTLSDEEARRRGTQKSVLERKSPPTFDVLIEIQERDRVVVHAPLAETVDEALRGRVRPPQLRTARRGRRDRQPRRHERCRNPAVAVRARPVPGRRTWSAGGHASAGGVSTSTSTSPVSSDASESGSRPPPRCAPGRRCRSFPTGSRATISSSRFARCAFRCASSITSTTPTSCSP